MGMFLLNSKTTTAEKMVQQEKMPKNIKSWMVLSILVTMCLMSTMVIQYLMHVRLADEVSDLKSEVQILKLKSQNPLPTMKWEPFKRQKRQSGGDIKTAEKSGVNVLDHAYQYGVDLKTESKLA